jgi:membrane protease subunit (stomatin/prohibitin family)
MFKKNPNETAFAGGKKNWSEVIKSPDTGNLLIWRHPGEDFNTNTTLVVGQGEQAIFIKGGAVEQVFDFGTYKLSTENYPFISRLRNVATGGISAFNCVIYFVSCATSRQVNWGTKGPMVVYDNELDESVQITGFGTYNVKVKEPTVFLAEILAKKGADFHPDELEDYIDGRMTQEIVSSIVQTLEDKDTMIFKVISKLNDFAAGITPQLNGVFTKIGLELENFSIMNLKPEESVRQAYNEMNREARKMVKLAQGQVGVMNTLGENWGAQQSVDIMKAMANNSGGGGAAAAGAGIGMGMAAAGMFGGMGNQMMNPMQQQMNPQMMQQPMQQTPASEVPAQAPANGGDDPMAALKKMKDMLDMGLIDQADFDAKKAEILSRM